MENSLLPAMLEFFMAHKEEPDKDFFSGTFDVLENTFFEILKFGVKTGFLQDDNVRVLAANIMFCIKGLETLDMAGGVSEKLLDTQFDFCKEIILSRKRGS